MWGALVKDRIDGPTQETHVLLKFEQDACSRARPSLMSANIWHLTDDKWDIIIHTVSSSLWGNCVPMRDTVRLLFHNVFLKSKTHFLRLFSSQHLFCSSHFPSYQILFRISISPHLPPSKPKQDSLIDWERYIWQRYWGSFGSPVEAAGR